MLQSSIKENSIKENSMKENLLSLQEAGKQLMPEYIESMGNDGQDYAV